MSTFDPDKVERFTYTSEYDSNPSGLWVRAEDYDNLLRLYRRMESTREVPSLLAPNREIISELYKTLVLLGADNSLLGTIGSWGDSLPDSDVLANLQGWNQETLRETRERIEHCEMLSREASIKRDLEVNINGSN
jgi:hypothetical protein